MFTARMESFHSQFNLQCPKAKFFASTMAASAGSAVDDWNNDKISKAFTTPQQGETKSYEELRREEMIYGSLRNERIFEAVMNAGTLSKKD